MHCIKSHLVQRVCMQQHLLQIGKKNTQRHLWQHSLQTDYKSLCTGYDGGSSCCLHSKLTMADDARGVRMVAAASS